MKKNAHIICMRSTRSLKKCLQRLVFETASQCSSELRVRSYGRPALKLHALVHDILPPTTTIVDYAIGLEKLTANELFPGSLNAVIL